MHLPLKSAAAGLLLVAGGSHAIQLDINNAQSVTAAAKTIANSVMTLYANSTAQSGIPGLFGAPYFWWESGLAWDSMVRYWAMTGDATFNDQVSKALLFQVGPDNNYMPPNQTATLGNDDQSTWALAAMTAAENDFPAPPSASGIDSWLQLAKNVFDVQAARWDTKTCQGGLRWQLFSFNAGFNYKSTLSNANLLQLAARLARYTGNQTYTDWATRVSDWSFETGLIANGSMHVYDGADTATNCSAINKLQWTSDYASFISGYAYMANVSSTKWSDIDQGLTTTAHAVFATTPNSAKANVLTEVECESHNTCNSDQLAFRAILARALSDAKALTADTQITSGSTTLTFHGLIESMVQASAEGAAAQCSGGASGTTCGTNWASGKWDGTTGLGQDLSALEIMLANLPAKQIVTANSATSTSRTNGTATSTGGTATGDGSPSGTGGAASASSTSSASRSTGSFVALVATLAFAVSFCA